jgi:deoxyguanosine kinase
MANLFEAPKFIVVEGPIRAGKSTLAQVLADKLDARRMFEPGGNPFLERFYRGEPGAAFPAQMWFLLERYEQIRQMWGRPPAGEGGAGANGRNGSLHGLRKDARPVVADYLFEKDKIFACINLSDAELDLYDRYYQMFRAEAPTPDLVIYLQASPEVLKQRLKRKGVVEERAMSDAYIKQVAQAYEHFFFHYTASDLLVVDTSEIDFVQRNEDLQLLLKRLSEPVKGTQYFLPLAARSSAS